MTSGALLLLHCDNLIQFRKVVFKWTVESNSILGFNPIVSLCVSSGLMCIRDMADGDETFEKMDMPFSTPSSSGHDVQLSVKHKRISASNRREFVKLALDYRSVLARFRPFCFVLSHSNAVLNVRRLNEFEEQVSAVRNGMSQVIPVPLLSLFTGYELETMVCSFAFNTMM